jgi:hypothetical protein
MSCSCLVSTERSEWRYLLRNGKTFPAWRYLLGNGKTFPA